MFFLKTVLYVSFYVGVRSLEEILKCWLFLPTGVGIGKRLPAWVTSKDYARDKDDQGLCFAVINWPN